MRRLSLLALVFFLAAPALFAGLAYNFESTTTGVRTQTMSGTVRVEGSNVRVDLTRGDGMFFKDGAVVVSTDGGKTLSVIEDATRSYYELNLTDLLGDLGGVMKRFGGAISLDVRNPKVNVRDRGNAGKLEGYAVRQSTVESEYDVIMNMMGQKMPIRVAMSTDVFWTGALSSEFTNFMQMRGVRTGIDAVDKILAAQTASIKGFPLKQVTRTNVNDMKSTTTSIVTGIRPSKIEPSKFAVPAGYTKSESPVQKMMRQFGGAR